jgi:multidrug efflux system membrane fusion protein
MAERPFESNDVTETKPKGRRRLGRILGLALLLVGGVSVVAVRSCKKAGDNSRAAQNAAAEARVVSVTTATAATRDVPIYVEGLGNATPLFTVTVRTQVDGTLDKIFFDEGRPVKKGELLAQIDPRPFQIQLQQAEAALLRDQAQLDNAKLNLDRFRQLLAKQLIAPQQLDDQTALARQLEGTVAADKATIANARLLLDYAHIRSPLDGVTGIRLVDPGNLVHAADPNGIVVITQLDPMAAIFTLPQDDLVRLSRYMSTGPLTVEAYSRDGATPLATGRLELVDNQINQATATIRLKARLPNSNRYLWPNQFLRMRVLLTVQKDALVVPTVAVQRGPQGTFVYVVGPDQTASLRPIEIATSVDQFALVQKGVSPGDAVVIEGQSQLRPGAKVSPHPFERAPGAPDAGPHEDAAKSPTGDRGMGGGPAKPDAGAAP